MNSMALVAFAAAMPLVSACASAAVPADRLANSEATIRSAQTMGASSEPQAALHVRLAQEQVDAAKSMMANGDNERAAQVLDRAVADAEVALALSHEAQVQKEATKAKTDVQSLRAKTAK